MGGSNHASEPEQKPEPVESKQMGKIPRPDIRDEHLKAIGGLFFDNFCAEHNVPDQMRPSVDPKPFMNWLPTQVAKYTYETLQAALEPVKITPDSARFMLELPFKGYGPNHIIALWPFLTLKDRPRRHQVHSVNMMVAIQFVDGTVVPINMLAHKDVSSEPLDDAHVVHLVITRTPDIATQISLAGLDVLHDKHAPKMQGFVSPKIVGLVRQLIAKAPTAAGHSGEGVVDVADPTAIRLTDEDRHKANMLISFVEQLFPGEIPDNVKAKITGQHLKQETPGGFDEG